MIDLLYLAWNRLEFTRKSFETMLANTDWAKISRLVVYDDGSGDGTREYLAERLGSVPAESEMVVTGGIGPVAIMIDYLRRLQQIDLVFAKIDNDVMLPPGWLTPGLQMLHDDPGIDLIGIEAMRPLGEGPYRFFEDEHIGGIGFMRSRAFQACAPAPQGRYGFTKWQTSHPHIKKGWIEPAIPVCLLNLMPFEPWLSLSRQYIAKGWQRDWPAPLPEGHKALWEWWQP